MEAKHNFYLRAGRSWGMTDVVEAMPDQPLSEPDLVALNNSDVFNGVAPYGGPTGADRVYAVMAITDARVYALGFDEETESWVRIAAFDTEAENVTGEVDRAVNEWVEETYPDAYEHVRAPAGEE